MPRDHTPPILAVHADWSVSAAKRWMSIATRSPAGWMVSAPRPVGSPTTLLERLRGWAGSAPVALGVDFPLGLPRTYVARHATAPCFLAFLRSLAATSRFFEPCMELSELAADRPFYPARGRAGMTRASHADHLMLGDAVGLSRLCDRATADRPAGAPLFWTLGANQTGKAAIAAWRDMLVPALAQAVPPRVWPFEGDLLALLGPAETVIAETYPAEAMRHIGVRLSGSKRRQQDRAGAAPACRAALAAASASPDPELTRAIDAGFGPLHGADDGFDSLMGLLGLLAVLDRRRPDGVPADPWVRNWEGWVLGQTALPGAPRILVE